MNGTALLEPGSAADAFSRQSNVFDDIDGANPLIGWVRDRVRAQALHFMRPDEELLELNAGTGIDSAFFASHGLRVLATDLAPGMLAQQQLKQRNASARWEIKECSFLELDGLADRRFHHVFSNFGGLNCTSRLDLVLDQIDGRLLPGGTCTLVIMPRFSPWEMLAALKGNFRLAFRRFKTNTPAHLEGIVFPCYYYSPAYIKERLGSGYHLVALRALSLLVPPPHMAGFPERWPRSFKALAWLEDRIATLPLIRNWGDHFIITVRKRA